MKCSFRKNISPSNIPWVVLRYKSKSYFKKKIFTFGVYRVLELVIGHGQLQRCLVSLNRI